MNLDAHISFSGLNGIKHAIKVENKTFLNKNLPIAQSFLEEKPYGLGDHQNCNTDFQFPAGRALTCAGKEYFNHPMVDRTWL